MRADIRCEHDCHAAAVCSRQSIDIDHHNSRMEGDYDLGLNDTQLRSAAITIGSRVMLIQGVSSIDLSSKSMTDIMHRSRLEQERLLRR